MEFEKWLKATINRMFCMTDIIEYILHDGKDDLKSKPFTYEDIINYDKNEEYQWWTVDVEICDLLEALGETVIWPDLIRPAIQSYWGRKYSDFDIAKDEIWEKVYELNIKLESMDFDEYMKKRYGDEWLDISGEE